MNSKESYEVTYIDVLPICIIHLYLTRNKKRNLEAQRLSNIYVYNYLCIKQSDIVI